MPIDCALPIRAISQAEFHLLDKKLMRFAFDAQNRLGRLMEEDVYLNEMAASCSASGLEAHREVMLRVRYDSFFKDYYADLVVDGSTIVEGKAVHALSPAHHGQTLNYLLLAGTQHGSLINFRSGRVARRFVSTVMTHAKRREFEVVAVRWPKDGLYRLVQEVCLEFSRDVGLGLEVSLYREAIVHLLALGAPVRIPVCLDNRTLGTQSVQLLSPSVALMITSLAAVGGFRTHVQRLLSSTSLESVAWINLEVGKIAFETIHK